MEPVFLQFGVHPFLHHLLPDSPFSHQGTTFAHLDSFLFLLTRAALATLATALFAALRPPFLFRQTHFVQVFPLKPAPFCKLCTGLGSANTAVSVFLLSDSRSVLATPSSPPFFFLPQTFWKIWQEMSFLYTSTIRLQWITVHSFLPGNDMADELARRGALLVPLQSPVVSLLLLLVSYVVFSRTGGVLFHLNSLAQRLPRFPPRNLCSLATLAVLYLVFAATDTA